MGHFSYLPSWDNAWRVTSTKEFLGMSRLLYHDVIVRVIDFSGNAVRVRDSGNIERIIRREDCSYSSWYIAQDNPGAIVTLKVRAWQ